MVYESINNWHLLHLQKKAGNTALVLHTSCINYDLRDLQRLAQLPFVWLVPDNIYWELKLLQESEIFSSKAAFILSQVKDTYDCGMSGMRKQWDLEQLYQNCLEPVLPSEIFEGTFVFIFGDLGKQDEFLCHSIELPGHYILMNDGWSCIKGQSRVCALQQFKNYTMRRPKMLLPGNAMPPVCELENIKSPEYNLIFKGKDLDATGKYGSYAGIYTCRKLPEQYIKIYKHNDLDGDQRKKLENLAYIEKQINHPGLALPESVLYNGAGHAVGYTMKRVPGQPLRDFLSIGWEGHDVALIFRSLALLLLELHTMHIIVNDLSYNNVMISSDDKVCMVDCDSFQIFDFPGGGITEMYRHREISADECHHTLREPRHEYFSFAVLLFQCLFYDDPLRQIQDEREDSILNWNDKEFPLDIDGRSRSIANQDILSLWNEQPKQIQKIFSDEFHFRREHSIGSWIRALELLE